jgi:multiple sugar transport system permease protein
MASLTPVQRTARAIPARRRLAFRLLDDRNVLGLLMIAPAAAFLLVFLAYPLGLGFWLGMTDATIGQPGRFIGFANFISLAHDQIFWLSVFNTTFYTVVARALKFWLGLYLAFWWIYDPQFSIISWSLIKLGLIHQYIDFLGQPWNARWSVIFANVWRGIPFVAITLLAGLQTISPSLYEAATLDGAGPWQRFRFVTLPMLSPIIAVVMTFSVLLTFTDFQLIYAITRGGPMNATQLMATLSFQRAITGGNLGEGAAIADAMVPFLLAAILFSYFGLQRRRWQQGSRD